MSSGVGSLQAACTVTAPDVSVSRRTKYVEDGPHITSVTELVPWLRAGAAHTSVTLSLVTASDSVEPAYKPGPLADKNAQLRTAERRTAASQHHYCMQPYSKVHSTNRPWHAAVSNSSPWFRVQQRRGRIAVRAATELRYSVPSEGAMAVLADMLAADLRPGDVYYLHGEVGAGKSVFSRAFIRAALADDTLPVPSPTYLLQNVYEGWVEPGEDPVPPIHHFDLYRLAGVHAGAWERLDLRVSFTQAVSLVEWPERVPEDMAPAQHLDVTIVIQQQDAESVSAAADGQSSDAESEFTDRRPRLVVLTGHGPAWQERMQRLQADSAGLQGQTSDLGLRLLR